MFVIGVTGSFGSGKTTVAHFFKRKAVVIIDADRIAHQLLEPGQKCYRNVILSFGRGIIKKGKIHRQSLATIIFKDPKARIRLNSIVHPEVIARTKKLVKEFRKAKTYKAVILDVPLLIESKMDKLCDFVVVVKASRILQDKRIKQRSGLLSEEVRQRIKAQIPLVHKIKQADFVVDNRGTLLETRAQVEQIWKKIFERTKKRRNV